MKKVLIGIYMICFALIACNGGGGGSKKKKDPCAGPVPCLTETWGYVDDQDIYHGEYAIFLDNGDPIVLISDGENMVVSGSFEIEGEIALVAVGGPVINCYEADINFGGVDYDLDGTVDYLFTSASGHLRVCAETLRIYDIVIEGEIQEDVSAAYDTMASLSDSSASSTMSSSTARCLSTDAPISAENVEKVKIRIKLLEQLMEE